MQSQITTLIADRQQAGIVATQPAVAAGPASLMVGNTHQAVPASFNGFTLESPSSTADLVSMEGVAHVEIVTPTVKQNIIQGKNINLASLLLPHMQGERSVEVEGSCLHLIQLPDPRLSKTLTIGEYITAFSTYKIIMCEAYPNRRQELDSYERNIVEMATRFGGTTFYEYHKQFSAKAAALLEQRNIRVNWAIRDNTLFCNLFAGHKVLACSLCNGLAHSEKFCPLSTTNRVSISSSSQGQFDARTRSADRSFDTLGRKRLYHQGTELCNNFNGRQGCFRNNCKFLHACALCRGPHCQDKCETSTAPRLSSAKSSVTSTNDKRD